MSKLPVVIAYTKDGWEESQLIPPDTPTDVSLLFHFGSFSVMTTPEGGVLILGKRALKGFKELPEGYDRLCVLWDKQPEDKKDEIFLRLRDMSIDYVPKPKLPMIVLPEGKPNAGNQ